MTDRAEKEATLARALWESDFFGFDASERQFAPVMRDWLRLSKTKLGVYLAEIDADAKFAIFESTEVIRLEKAVQDNAPAKADGLAALRLIAKIIGRLNRSGLARIAPARLHELVRVQKNKNCCKNVVEAQRLLEDWRRAKRRWISSLVAPMKDRTNVPSELAILSGILDGEILDVDLALALEGASLAKGQRFALAMINRDGGSRSCMGVYIDLLLPWQGLQDEEARRWHGSMVQASLFARVRRGQSTAAAGESADPKKVRSDRKADLYGRIRAGLSAHGVNPEEMPRSLVHLIRTVADAYFTEAPQLLIEYWTRRSHSRSLRPSCIGRITGMPSTMSAAALATSAAALLKEEGDVPDSKSILRAARARKSADEPYWLVFLRRSFREQEKKAVAGALRAYAPPADEDPLIGRRLVEFALLLVESEASTGRRWEPETVEGCVLTVARRLGVLFPTADPATRPAKELERAYWQAIEDSLRDSRNHRSMQRAVAWALREFHRFLLTKGAPPVDESSIFKASLGLIAVDARIISLDDCYAMVDYIKHKSRRTVKIQAAAIAELIFGFGAGLRRMEGLGLRKKDWPNGTYSMILVREWEMRGLKTPNAFRWLPLALFIPEDLLKEADAWREFARVVEDGDHLLRVSDSESNPVKEEEVIGLINEAMCVQMKDNSCHYHLLRHSFAHWAALRLLLSDLDDCESVVADLFPHLPKTMKWLQQSGDFRRSLYGNDLVSNDHAWALATLMGHCSPEVATTHYVHCLCLTGFLYVQRAFGGPSDEDLLYAMGLPERTRQAHQHDARNVAVRFLKDRFAAIPMCVDEEPAPTWIDQAYGLLDQYQQTLQPADQIAPYFHLSLSKAKQLIVRSLELSGMLAEPGPTIGRLWHETIYLPPKPPEKLRAEILDLARKVEVAVQNVESRAYAFQKLSSFVVNAGNSAVEFADVASAKAYVLFLGTAKIGRKDLSFELRGVRKGSEKALPFEEEFGRNLRFVASRLAQENPVLTIQPIHVRQTGGDTSGQAMTAGAVTCTRLYSREAFVFVMQMASIVFGVRNDQEGESE